MQICLLILKLANLLQRSNDEAIRTRHNFVQWISDVFEQRDLTEALQEIVVSSEFFFFFLCSHWCVRNGSYNACRSLPAHTADMSNFPFGMNCISAGKCLRKTWGYWTRLDEMFGKRFKKAAVLRNIFITALPFIESSGVLSGDCVHAVWTGFNNRPWRNQKRAQIRSERLELRLYSMADEPIWDFSKDFSDSFIKCSKCISFFIDAALLTEPINAATTPNSCSCINVCLNTAQLRPLSLAYVQRVSGTVVLCRCCRKMTTEKTRGSQSCIWHLEFVARPGYAPM